MNYRVQKEFVEQLYFMKKILVLSRTDRGKYTQIRLLGFLVWRDINLCLERKHKNEAKLLRSRGLVEINALVSRICKDSISCELQTLKQDCISRLSLFQTWLDYRCELANVNQK